MRITIALKDRLSGDPEATREIEQLVKAAGNYCIVEVFNRGRYASLDVSTEEYHQLQGRLGSRCSFQASVDISPRRLR